MKMKNEITILQMPGSLEWGIFTTAEHATTHYRFKIEANEALVEKQAYMKDKKGNYYLGGVGRDLHLTLTRSLKEELMQKGLIEQR